jgi:RecG-like helicase
VPSGCIPIADVRFRQHAKVGGRVHTQRVRPWSGIGTLECTLVDGTGAITVVFLGRRHVPGIDLGTHMVVEGTVGQHGGRLAILNPIYELFREP